MNHTLARVAFALGLLVSATFSFAEEQAWTPLFNGRDLAGFYTFVGPDKKNDDPEKYFTVTDGMIHVMDLPVSEDKRPFGYIATEKTYENFHLRFQYKWGTKRYVPRAKSKRDSGVLYHVIGADKVWPQSMECQIQEGDTGDLWIVGTVASVNTTVKSLDDKEKTYAPGGVAYNTGKGRVIKSMTADTLDGWNTVEVIAKGNSAVHIVNGKVVLKITDMTLADETKKPLSSGHIAFQAEGAEVFYRDIEIRPLRADEDLPDPTPVPATQPTSP